MNGKGQQRARRLHWSGYIIFYLGFAVHTSNITFTHGKVNRFVIKSENICWLE